MSSGLYLGGDISGAYCGGDVSAIYKGSTKIYSAESDEFVVIDGLKYRTVTIGTQTWIAENLQIETSNSYFYNNDEATYGRNGLNYGRLYTWDAAKSITVSGWHIPSRTEWAALFSAVGGTNTAGKVLKSTSGWKNSGNGTDDYGFTAEPAGNRTNDGSFSNAGSYASFWSSTEYNSSYEYRFYLDYRYASVSEDYKAKSYACSIRLVKDT